MAIKLRAWLQLSALTGFLCTRAPIAARLRCRQHVQIWNIPVSKPTGRYQDGAAEPKTNREASEQNFTSRWATAPASPLVYASSQCDEQRLEPLQTYIPLDANPKM